ncbi:MAG TPA: hypothetical protein VMS17_19875 [Gemmataceae bacterium]|nr:hypothetical protein [Gemmataceae bacterium]
MSDSVLPFPNNTTCDIYRAGRFPPATPDVADVPCLLIPYSRNIKPLSAAPATYTHLLRVAVDADIRDANMAGPDTIYVPDKSGVPFLVQWVTRHGRNTALDHKECLLMRQNPTYPTNEG